MQDSLQIYHETDILQLITVN